MIVACLLPIVIRMFKSRRMRWAGHVARMGEGKGMIGEDRTAYKENQKERDH
jgi:hypothetical protein